MKLERLPRRGDADFYLLTDHEGKQKRFMVSNCERAVMGDAEAFAAAFKRAVVQLSPTGEAKADRVIDPGSPAL